MKRIPAPYMNWQSAASVMHSEQLEEVIFQCVEVLDFYHQMDEAPEEIQTGDTRWEGNEMFLAAYAFDLCDDWKKRAGKEHPLASRIDFHFECEQEAESANMVAPDFLTDENELMRDRALLFELNPDYYIELFDAGGKKV